MSKWGLSAFLVIVALPVFGQVKTYGREKSSTTPLNCRSTQMAHMQGYCDGVEWMVVQQNARLRGGITPSERVVELPDIYSSASKQLGYACAGGYAMQRIKGGWKQVNDAQYRPMRCRVR